MSKELFEQMAQTILDGEEDVAAELAQKALDEASTPWSPSPKATCPA